MAEPGSSIRHQALLVSSFATGEGAGYLQLFSRQAGALSVKAPGIARQQSKLAPLLQPADELLLTLSRGRGTSAILTGIAVERDHSLWRGDLDLLALYWFFTECAYIGSAGEADNELVYRLVVNLLRSDPAEPARPAALCVFCLKLLAIHGLLPDLLHCSITGELLGPRETAYLMPGGQGLICLAEYDRRYARSGVLHRLDGEQRLRWLSLLSGPLLGYPHSGADRSDAALLLHLCVQALADIAAREIAAAKFLSVQWKLAEQMPG